jgi:hypothetical protein
MQFSSAERAAIVDKASQIVAGKILSGITDIEDLVTLPMDMVEQTTGLGAPQISPRMPVRSLTGRKRGVSLKVVRNYLRNIESDPGHTESR